MSGNIIPRIGQLLDGVELPPNMVLDWRLTEPGRSFRYRIEMQVTDIHDRKTPIRISQDKEMLVEFLDPDRLREQIQERVAHLAMLMLEHEFYEWFRVGGKRCAWYKLGENHDHG